MRLGLLVSSLALCACDGGGGQADGGDGGAPPIWADGTLLVGTNAPSSADGFGESSAPR